MKQIPKIEKYMTAMPHTINPEMPIRVALDMMREHQIRHIPVQKDGDLVGVITDRDIKLSSAFQGKQELKVEDVMTQDPYSVKPQTAADVIALEMAEHKYGCAIVRQENGKIVGIFTATDGLRVLGELMQERFKN